MKRPVRRYVEKFEALDLSTGAYHARKLPRARYTQTDFLEYLNAADWLDDTGYESCQEESA